MVGFVVIFYHKANGCLGYFSQEKILNQAHYTRGKIQPEWSLWRSMCLGGNRGKGFFLRTGLKIHQTKIIYKNKKMLKIRQTIHFRRITSCSGGQTRATFFFGGGGSMQKESLSTTTHFHFERHSVFKCL